MSPERTNGHTLDRLQQLFNKFDLAKGLKERDRLGSQIATFATEDSLDCVTLLRAIDKGFTTRDSGSRIVEGVEKYFQSRNLIVKTLFPSSQAQVPPDAKIRQFSGLISAVKAHAGDTVSPRIRSFMLNAEYMEHSLRERIVQGQNGSTYLEFHDRNNWSDEQKKSYREIVLGQGTALSGTSIHNVDLTVDAPDKVLELLKQLSRRGTEEFRDIDMYAVQFAGVSLEDLSKEQDGKEFFKKALSFLGAVPRGDVYWTQLVEGIFFTPLVSGTQSEEEQIELLRSAPFTQKILEFHQLLAATLLQPGFVGSPRHEEIDKLVANIFKWSDEQTAFLIAGAVYMSATSNSMLFQMLHSELPVWEAIAKHCLVSIAAAYRFDQEKPDRKIRMIDDITRAEIIKQWSRIKSDMKTRFGKGEAVKSFLNAFENILSKNEWLTQRMQKQARAQGGEGLMLRAKERGTELEEVRRLLWDDLSTNKDLAYELNPDALHTIVFSQDSLPEMLGLESVAFVPNREQGIVEFLILSKGAAAGLAGEISESGEISLNPELGSAADLELRPLLNYITISTYHDLLLRETIIKEQTEKKKQPASGIGEGDTARSLPRRQTIYIRNGERAPTTISSGELVETINREREKRGFKPRKVDIHKTRLRGSYKYEDAVAAGNMEEIERTRPGVFRPSAEKVRNLPPKFQLDKITDPITGEDVCLETWVVAYSAPKLTEEEEQNLVVHYEKKYRGGSAMLFLDYIKSWIVE